MKGILEVFSSSCFADVASISNFRVPANLYPQNPLNLKYSRGASGRSSLEYVRFETLAGIESLLKYARRYFEQKVLDKGKQHCKFKCRRRVARTTM